MAAYVFCNITCFAQNGSFDGIGNASVSLSDIWSINNNQAGLASIKDYQVSAYYENKFTIKETASSGIAIVIPTQMGNFSVSYSHYGYELYSENATGIAYSKLIGKSIMTSVKFSYVQYIQPTYYGNKGVPILEIGVIYEPVEKLFIGMHIFNPSQQKLNNYQSEQIESILRFGASYHFSNKLFACTEIYKNIIQQARFKCGLSYEPIKSLYFRTGLKTNPSQFSFGTGYSFSGLVLDMSVITHTKLPLSYQCAMKYIF